MLYIILYVCEMQSCFGKWNAIIIAKIYHTQSLELLIENCSKNTNAPLYFADFFRVAEYFN